MLVNPWRKMLEDYKARGKDITYKKKKLSEMEKAEIIEVFRDLFMENLELHAWKHDAELEKAMGKPVVTSAN